jgi:putative ABC transport system ATP-binding protein
VPILSAHDITKIYETRGVETPALRGIDLEIEEGEFTALSGPSGSGKTTLLNILGALDTPTTGRVTLDGQDLSELSAAELSELRLHKLGFVFQAYNLIPVLTARENVEFVMELQGVPPAFVMELQGVPPAERASRALALLEDVGLGGLGDKRPLEMSGGQQQRVAVARAIASHPRVVLADEPTANLDSTTAGQLLDLMEKLNQDRRVTFLFSTHDPLVMERARRNVRLHDGMISHDETKSE